jgi:hypothetical protein
MTFSTVIWTFFKCYSADSFPVLAFFLRMSLEFRRISKLVKLMKFMRQLEPLFARQTCALFLLLNSMTFLRDPNRLSLQELSIANPIWLATFGELFPFSRDSLGGFMTCYDQLQFIAGEICHFQEFVIGFVASFVPSICPSSVPFSQFMPIMSLAQISIAEFLRSSGIIDPVEVERQLRSVFSGPIVLFAFERFRYEDAPRKPADESPDFLGLCECDWRHGLARSAAPIPKWSGTVLFQRQIDRRFALFASLLRIFDFSTGTPARETFGVDPGAVKWREESRFGACFDGSPPEMTASDGEARWIDLLPQAVRSEIKTVPDPSD